MRFRPGFALADFPLAGSIPARRRWAASCGCRRKLVGRFARVCSASEGLRDGERSAPRALGCSSGVWGTSDAREEQGEGRVGAAAQGA